MEHQCVNHFALGWTLLTPSAWICIPHEARRRRRGSQSARARPVFSATGPHSDLDQILSSTVRARVTLSGFDTQGTTAPNEAPCRSRQEATLRNASRFRCCYRAALSLLVIETRERENKQNSNSPFKRTARSVRRACKWERNSTTGLLNCRDTNFRRFP